MKQALYVFIAALGLSLAACQPKNPPVVEEDPHSQMQVLVNGIGVIHQDTTIVVHDALLSLSGEMQMEVRGEFQNVVKKLEVFITRSAIDRIDEFCTANTCTMCNGEEQQHLSFNLGEETSATWFAHYTLPETGDTDYIVSYKFVNYDREMTLTVHYDYQESE